MIEDKEALKFLIVEDDPDYAKFLHELVKACFGASSVKIVENPTDALAAMTNQDFDVCFLDYYLDTETGLDVLRNPEAISKPTAYIMLTSRVDRNISIEALRLGAMDYLVKGTFDRFDLERSVAYAVYRRQKEIDLLREALRDPLTGLGNRELFMEQANLLRQQAQRDGSIFAVVYMDIDNFKPVNDTYGHHVGDKLLQRVAKRIQDRLRGSDAVARLGGDEFIVLLSKVRNAESAATVSEELALAIRQPYLIDDLLIEIRISIGVALFPADADGIDHLTRLADARMYENKNAAQNKSQTIS